MTLIPNIFQEEPGRDSIEEIKKELNELRASHEPISWETLKKWRDEGRR